MEKPNFVTNSIYHLYNRGVEKRRIFLDREDHLRFIHDLFEFNDEEPAPNLYYWRAALKSYEVQPRKISQRKLLVEIIAFCLISNHFHLLVRQARDNGIIRFMQKLGTGYAMYFNQKYERVGGLFQGRFKAALIKNQRHFLYLPHYIHLNPLDLAMPRWRDGTIPNVAKAIKFLGSYRWSSYLDYIGEKNFPSVISKNLFQEFYGTPSEYKQALREWLADMRINEISDVALE